MPGPALPTLVMELFRCKLEKGVSAHTGGTVHVLALNTHPIPTGRRGLLSPALVDGYLIPNAAKRQALGERATPNFASVSTPTRLYRSVD